MSVYNSASTFNKETVLEDVISKKLCYCEYQCITNKVKIGEV